MLGAIAVGGTAWARVSMLTDPLSDRALHSALAQPPNGATTTGG